MAHAFDIGRDGQAWIRRLQHSSWFSGLVPTAEDLEDDPTARAAGAWRPDTEAGVDFAEAPQAPLATIAIGADVSAVERQLMTHLIHALRARRHGRCCRTTVVMTVDPGNPAAEALSQHACAAGAFVITADGPAAVDHLHHFPLRMAVTPCTGERLICVDLADHLSCLPSGYAGRLRRLSANCPWPPAVRRGLFTAVRLHWHDDAGGGLAYLA